MPSWCPSIWRCGAIWLASSRRELETMRPHITASSMSGALESRNLDPFYRSASKNTFLVVCFSCGAITLLRFEGSIPAAATAGHGVGVWARVQSQCWMFLGCYRFAHEAWMQLSRLSNQLELSCLCKMLAAVAFGATCFLETDNLDPWEQFTTGIPFWQHRLVLA